MKRDRFNESFISYSSAICCKFTYLFPVASIMSHQFRINSAFNEWKYGNKCSIENNYDGFGSNESTINHDKHNNNNNNGINNGKYY